MNATAEETITATPLHEVIGLRVEGVDLDSPLSPPLRERVHGLWMKGLLLVFPGQDISDEALVAFGRHFGELEIHPSVATRAVRNPEIYRVSNIDENGDFIPPRNEEWRYVNMSWRWHSDSSFREVPSMGSILHGIETTSEGGNTLFANLYAAWEGLDDETKARVRGLRVVHDHDRILELAGNLGSSGDRSRYMDMPPVVHPLVQVHPVTGRASLFLSPHTMTGIEGMADADARALLDALIAHATAEHYVYRHRWTPHDVIMWDNRCTMHSVEPYDNEGVRRVMHRVTLAGEARPVALG